MAKMRWTNVINIWLYQVLDAKKIDFKRHVAKTVSRGTFNCNRNRGFKN